MPTRRLGATDRIAIEDLLRNYVYCNDTNDVEGMLALFTEDAVLEIGTRERFETRQGIRRFATEHGAQPGRAGRQHLYQQIQMKRTATGCTVRSYWMVVQSIVATNSKLIRQIGYYDDTCVKIDGRWLIQHKFIDLWNDETPPPLRL
jgi:SnoaL-like domain